MVLPFRDGFELCFFILISYFLYSGCQCPIFVLTLKTKSAFRPKASERTETVLTERLKDEKRVSLPKPLSAVPPLLAARREANDPLCALPAGTCTSSITGAPVAAYSPRA